MMMRRIGRKIVGLNGLAKISICCVALLNMFTSVAQDKTRYFLDWKEDKKCMDWVDSVYLKLSPEERIGQFFMLAAYTNEKDFNMPKVLAQIQKGNAGGVIFFKGNPRAQVDWTNTLQSQAKVGAFVAIDGEWGLSMRIDSTTIFPRQMTLGAIANSHNHLIYAMGKEIGRQCRRMGIHINFAPSVDVNNNPNNPVINERSFGEDKFRVALKGLEYAQGMQEEGVLACAKHFPGHGDVNTDSHFDLPQINKSIAGFDSTEFFPFKILFENSVGSVMVAHLNTPALDTATGSITSVSKRIATEWLKDSLRFQGLVFSDALNMKGVAKKYNPGTVDSMAFVSGIDILVFSEDPEKGIQKIKAAVDSGTISTLELEARVKKVLAFKYKLGLNKPQVINTQNLTNELNTIQAEKIRTELFERAITFAANKDNLLPLVHQDFSRTASLSIGNNGISSFQKHISLFANPTVFNQADEKDEKAFSTLLQQLSDYNLVIVDLHGMVRAAARGYNIAPATQKFIQELSLRTKVVLMVFGNPYSLQNFEGVPWVVCAYEENEITNMAAANALFGAQKVSGKLPVTSCKTFTVGTGFSSDTIYRLKISTPISLNINPAKLNRLDDVIDKAIRAKAFPGCQLLVAKDGEVIWHKAYGTKTYSTAEPVNNTDVYDIASITKTAATTLAVMKLYEQKKIDLDKTLDHYLKLDDSATIKKLKLKDVLLHEAGLKPFFMFWKETVNENWPNYYRNIAEKGFELQVADSMFIRNDFADTMWHIMAHSAVAAKPKYEYSDLDFYILQKVVEQVSGQPLDQYVAKNFYQPMELTTMGYKPSTRFEKTRIIPTENDTAFRKQLIQGFVHDQGAAMYGGVAGHAGLFSNAFDLAGLYQMLLNKGTYNGQRYLDSATVAFFTARQSKISRRGLGFDKPEPDFSKPSPCYDNVPLSVFGHTGFTGTCIWSDPTNQLTYVFLSNRINPSAENNLLVKMGVRTELQEVIYKAIETIK
jgi:beta-N-acetylhexosaminidase